jgi:hypothetical protein
VSLGVHSPWACICKASRNLDFHSVSHYFVDSHYQDAPQAIQVSGFNETVPRNSTRDYESLYRDSDYDDHRNRSESLFVCDVEREPETSFRSLESQISQRFRQLGLYTPSLWSVIHLSPGNISRELAQLPTYLERSEVPIAFPPRLEHHTFHIIPITKGPPSHRLFSRATSPCSHLSTFDSDSLDFAFQGLRALEMNSKYGIMEPGQHF